MEKETFDLLFSCFKIIKENMVVIPEQGTQLKYTATKSDDERETFNMYINRKGKLNTEYLTYLLHSRHGILVRLDMDGTPHENYKGDMIETPHLHIFNQENNFGKIAIPLSSVTNIELLEDISSSLKYFMLYNNIELIDFDANLFE